MVDQRKITHANSRFSAANDKLLVYLCTPSPIPSLFLILFLAPLFYFSSHFQELQHDPQLLPLLCILLFTLSLSPIYSTSMFFLNSFCFLIKELWKQISNRAWDFNWCQSILYFNVNIRSFLPLNPFGDVTYRLKLASTVRGPKAKCLDS